MEQQEESPGGIDPQYNGGDVGESYAPYYGLDPHHDTGGGGDESLRSALPPRSSFSELFLTQSSPDPGAMDEGLAWSLLAFSFAFMVVAMISMVIFFRARNVFEIRARSAYLVMLTGTCFLAVVIMIVQLQVFMIFDLPPDIYTMLTIYYFALVCSTCCYGSRAIRLAVLYSPRARKNMPWLAPERNHLCACVFLGIVAMSVPLYDMWDIDKGPDATITFVDRSTQHLWKVTIACQCVVVALYPFVRKIEDIFNIMTELRAMMIWKLLVIVGGRVGEIYGDRTVSRWVNQDNMGYIGIITMFVLSVIWPIHQRLFHPLESSDPKVVQALARRKRSGPITVTSVSSLTVGESRMLSPSVVNSPDFQYKKKPATFFSPLWTYEKVVAVPEISEAFEEFSRKALCQELVMFLKDVTVFQAQRVCGEDADSVENGCGNCCGNSDSGNSGGNSGGNRGGNSDGGEERSLTFSEIVRKYVVDGAPDEINISSTDKKIILDVYNARNLDFRELSAKERRFVFSRAYAEVRFMLESNLLSRFMSTSAFKLALDRAENNSTPPSA